ncbi:hypothetical protein HETIRDRAFT_452226 [Heterobasidion irregulare TC 32-1]|uniref:Uncharacterized protein n=1 Tax=Heterobasidion irregulare (strain TC 32-1) TaxID=747525 RepID=W4K4K8_HETIT|nr:uncharacterized protein HETIRDRAFT_452226 [Heterobasidion irregulare TC 32-1]ETW80689.1 hypothetical protein HETIRDRAFT_452226 [Heterobasidion irregulare TC 32-1]
MRSIATPTLFTLLILNLLTPILALPALGLLPIDLDDCHKADKRSLSMSSTACQTEPVMMSHGQRVRPSGEHSESRRGGALPLVGGVLPHIPIGPNVESPPPTFMGLGSRRLKKGPRSFVEETE